MFYHILDYITQNQSTNNRGKIGLSTLVVAIATVIRNKQSIKSATEKPSRHTQIWRLDPPTSPPFLRPNGLILATWNYNVSTGVSKPSGESFQFVVTPCCTPKRLDCCSGMPLIRLARDSWRQAWPFVLDCSSDRVAEPKLTAHGCVTVRSMFCSSQSG